MQLTCTLAIFACFCGRCSRPATCPPARRRSPSPPFRQPEAGDALRAPALEMVSLTRGINGRASCDARRPADDERGVAAGHGLQIA